MNMAIGGAMTSNMLVMALLASVLGLGLAVFLYGTVKAQASGNETMEKIARLIREGAKAFLWREYRVLMVYAIVMSLVLLGAFDGWTSLAFLFGAFLSLLAGFFGMMSATSANVKVAQAARDLKPALALKIALDGGAVMGLSVASLALLGLVVVAGLAPHEQLAKLAHAFAVGASSIALFARVGGGIYTKAADVGSDIAGKVLEGIPEDDPRNPGVIADNVGDNVGDVAGMGADIYESLVAAVVAGLAIGLTAPENELVKVFGEGVTPESARLNMALLPLLLAGLGLWVSIIVILVARQLTFLAPSRLLKWALLLPPVGLTLVAAGVRPFLGFSLEVVWSLGVGAFAGAVVGLLTDYYTGMKPIRDIARASITGAGTNVIRGLAVGMESVVPALLVLAVTAAVANHWLGLYGVALAAVGMLAATAVVMTVDAYGPIADNAGGISEMSGLGPEVRAITDELDAVGNTTAAIGKGFAIGSAILTVVALFSAFTMDVNFTRFQAGQSALDLRLDNPQVLVGLLLGSLLPFLVASTTMLSVGRAAQKIVLEIARQFKEIVGLREGRAEPDSARIVDIATRAALWEMLIPGLVAVLAPAFVGFVLGPLGLAGLLAGALASGATLSLFMANAGGAWDNAKKFIEKGLLEGHKKGSDAHKAAVIGDTVGDPFKDTSGPAVSILIKVMSVVSLLVASLIALR